MGVLGAVHQLVQNLDLPRRIDENVHVLKAHRPHHESDHVLNLAYNAFCGGRTLKDIKLRRNDEAHLDALGVEAIPDPTTAGGFCRRSDETSIEALQDAINEVRVEVWQKQEPAFFDKRARIDVDGSIVPTTAGQGHSGVCTRNTDTPTRWWCLRGARAASPSPARARWAPRPPREVLEAMRGVPPGGLFDKATAVEHDLPAKTQAARVVGVAILMEHPQRPHAG